MALKKIKKFVASLILAGLVSHVDASNIFIGNRGPTDFQLDQRISYIEKETSPANENFF